MVVCASGCIILATVGQPRCADTVGLYRRPVMEVVLESVSLAGARWEGEPARAAAEAEFEAVELPIAPQAALTPETDRARCLDILRSFREAGVRVAALRADFGEHCQLASPSPETRREARGLLSVSLQRGRWLGAEVLSIPALVLGSRRDGPEAGSYAETLAWTGHSLTALVPDAEVCGLRLALDVPGERFLTNPVETAELIDRVNSPWVGVGLDLDRCAGQDSLSDWLVHLGWRLAAVRLRQVGETVETGLSGRLGQLLAEVGFDGPVVVAGGSGSWWTSNLGRAGPNSATSSSG